MQERLPGEIRSKSESRDCRAASTSTRPCRQSRSRGRIPLTRWGGTSETSQPTQSASGLAKHPSQTQRLRQTCRRDGSLSRRLPTQGNCRRIHGQACRTRQAARSSAPPTRGRRTSPMAELPQQPQSRGIPMLPERTSWERCQGPLPQVPRSRVKWDGPGTLLHRQALPRSRQLPQTGHVRAPPKLL